MPDFIGDFFLICCALLGTVVAACMAIVGPIMAVFSGLCSALSCCCAAPLINVGGAVGGLTKQASVSDALASFHEQVRLSFVVLRIFDSVE